ncbi:MAG TPA: DUF5681 domain-containing protein [Polyangiales bacterium]|nr:DUF5681 domain-containing protein [Polyangiales bacterium]
MDDDRRKLASQADRLKDYRWKPGQSGNPNGQPKRPTFEVVVARILDEEVPGSDITKREALARVFVAAMLQKNGQMIREYLARSWPVVQKHEVELPGVGTNALETALDRFRPNGSAGVSVKPNGNGAA